MEQKVKSYIPKVIAYLRSLQDVRMAGQLLFVVIVLLISWSGVKAIQTNYSLQKHISTLRQETEVQKLRNQNLKLQNEYFKSNQYLELSARQNFGLAAPGEKVLIVPEEVALANTVDLPNTATKDVALAHQPGYQKNLNAWLKFFLHRQSN
jgi:cell division protein FtsB